MKFSERNNFTNVRTIIQLDTIDEPLKNSIWNVVDLFLFKKDKDEFRDSLKAADVYPLIEEIWFLHFKLPVDKLNWNFTTAINDLRDIYFNKLQWYEVYDLVEFIANTNYASKNYLVDKFTKVINSILKNELSGYRFINNRLIRLTEEEEIQEIESALISSSKLKIPGVKIHLSTAIEKLADRKNPDYRNSIKESISAIESLCQIITGDSRVELGKALRIIKDKIGMHTALEQGFMKIYGYTSDGDGIRHSLLENSTLDYEDAQYMLVSCSAFINYLIVKSNKAGIDI